jgi:hypothetical protein
MLLSGKTKNAETKPNRTHCASLKIDISFAESRCNRNSHQKILQPTKFPRPRNHNTVIIIIIGEPRGPHAGVFYGLIQDPNHKKITVQDPKKIDQKIFGLSCFRSASAPLITDLRSSNNKIVGSVEKTTFSIFSSSIETRDSIARSLRETRSPKWMIAWTEG